MTRARSKKPASPNIDSEAKYVVIGLRPLVAQAYELLGGNHSRMLDDETEVAHALVESVLRRIDETLGQNLPTAVSR